MLTISAMACINYLSSKTIFIPLIEFPSLLGLSVCRWALMKFVFIVCSTATDWCLFRYSFNSWFGILHVLTVKFFVVIYSLLSFPYVRLIMFINALMESKAKALRQDADEKEKNFRSILIQTSTSITLF